MTRLLVARVSLSLTGALVWGFGYRADRAELRLAGMAIVGVALVLRFLPHRWLGDEDRS